MRRKIETAESAAEQAQQQQQQAEQQQMQQVEQNKMLQHQDEMDMTRYKTDTDAITKIRVAEMTNETKQQQIVTAGKNNIPDEVDLATVAIKEREHLSKKMAVDLLHNRESLKIMTTNRLEQEKLETAKGIAKLKADAEKYKADVSLKVAKENKPPKAPAKKKV